MPEYDLTYLHKKRRKKIVASVMTIATVLIIILCLIGLLAKHPGAFTVSVEKGSASLTLSKTEDMEEGPKSYLTTPKIPGYHEYTYENFAASLVGEIDDDGFVTPSPEEDGTIPYFKYTFFVKNLGEDDVDYNLALDFTIVGDSTTNPRGLDSVLRVQCYENLVGDGKHEYKIYAKRSSTDKAQDVETKEYYYLPERLYDNPLAPFTEPFVSARTIMESEIHNLHSEEMMRYTFVFWVEGTDPDCLDAPPNNQLKVAVKINARKSSTQNDPEQE